MSQWLYLQAVASAARAAVEAHLVYLSLPLEVPVQSLEDIVRDLIRQDPLPCCGIQRPEDREIMFDWSFGPDDVAVIVAEAEKNVHQAAG